MTDVAVHGGGALANPGDFDPNLGLEDVSASDLIIPRINIDHDNALFVNSMTKETFSGLLVVVLGLVKQRVMWPSKLEDDSKPQCKSTDNVHGFPNTRPGQPSRNLFPWSKSNFEPSHAQPVEISPGEDARYPNGWSSNGYDTLSCDACIFAKWGKDDDGNNTPPPCNEQHTYPLLYLTKGMDEDGTEFDHWQPAIFTVQRSSIKNSRAFINAFAQSQQPFFTYYTELTLTTATRGKNEFAIPNFKRVRPSDRNSWGEYGTQLRSIREFLRAAPRPQEGEGDDEGGTAPSSSNENVGPSNPPAPPSPPDAPAAPAAAPPQPPAAEAVPQPSAPQAPVAPAPPSPPTPPPAPPQTQAPAAPAPPAPPAPPTPPPAPPQAPTQSPPEPPAPPASGGLPF